MNRFDSYLDEHESNITTEEESEMENSYFNSKSFSPSHMKTIHEDDTHFHQEDEEEYTEALEKEQEYDDLFESLLENE